MVATILKDSEMAKHTYKGKTYDIPYRDSRRQKCYNGEREAFGQSFRDLIGRQLEDVASPARAARPAP